MKITKTNKWGRFPSVLILGVALLVSSCIKDNVDSPRPIDNSEDITLVLSIPSGGNIHQTRAITEGSADDNQVATIDVVLFDKTTGKYMKIVPGNAIEDDGASNKKKFSISVLKGTWDMLILANARSIIESELSPAANHTELQKKTMAEIENMLVMTNDSKWNASPSDAGYKPFPMWGKKMNITVPTSDSKITGIDMVRMVSKINLRFGSKAVSDKFTLQEIKLCNYDTKGYVTSPNWKTGKVAADEQSLYQYAGRGSNGIESLAKGYANGLSYTTFADITNPSSTSEQVQAITDEIFLFETAKPTTSSDWIDATCLLVKGKFKEGDQSERWFRINIRELNAGVWEHLNLVRNYRYEVVINDIKGRGHDDDKTAYNSLPEGLEIGIVVWNDAGLADYATDGQYLLGVSQNEFEFYKDKEVGNVFYIYTDYTDDVTKMSVTPSYPENTDTGWITNGTLVRDATGDTSDKRFCFKYTFDCEENAGDVREATLKVNAKGRLEVPVHIKQLDYSASILTIESDGHEIDELLFSAGVDEQPAAQTYTVKWSPSSETLYTSTNPVAKPGATGTYYGAIAWTKYSTLIGNSSTPIDQDFVYTSPILDASGKVQFTVQPEKISTSDMGGDPFYERQTQVNFRANSPKGILRGSVVMQQVVETAQAIIEPFYLADGSEYNFIVKSNREWRVTLKNDGGGMITNGEGTVLQTGGYNLPEGGKVRFKTVDDLSNPTRFTGTGIVTLEYKDSNDNWIIVSQNGSVDLPIFCATGIIQPYSNTYMLKPGANSVPILIPVNRANGYISEGVLESNWTTLMGANANQITGAFEAGVVWTDTPNSKSITDLIGENGAVRRIITLGSDAKGYIFVQAGKTAGNTVIYVKSEGSDKIAWSWHIWTSDYIPYDGTKTSTATPNTIWMDRNLGAVTAGYNATDPTTSYGLYYQWGRKDPMPGFSKGNVRTTYYTPSAISSGEVPVISSSIDPTLSFASPLSRYKEKSSWAGCNGDKSWATNYNKSSGRATKTLYDPCPDGYQVSVRKTAAYNAADNLYHWGQEISKIPFPDPNEVGGVTLDKGGFFPLAATYLNPARLNSSGYCWTANYGYSGENMYFPYTLYILGGPLDNYYYPSWSAGLTGGGIPTYNGVPVRCVVIPK